MARFHDLVGYEFAEREDPQSPGEFLPSQIEERPHFGTILHNQRRWENPANTSTNDDVTLTNRISIVADAYMHEHWPAIKYVRLGGKRWKVQSIEVAFPRLILTLGGVWNGPTA